MVWRCGRDCRKGTVGINMTRVFGRADYFCNIAPRKFTYIACKDDILVRLVHGQGLFFSITRGTKVYFIAWKGNF